MAGKSTEEFMSIRDAGMRYNYESSGIYQILRYIKKFQVEAGRLQGNDKSVILLVLYSSSSDYMN